MTYDEAGLNAARRYAQWHIGDGSWAIAILDAYSNPERTHRHLDDEMRDDDV